MRRRLKNAASLVFGLILGLILVLGCHAVLGDYAIEKGDAGTEPPPPCPAACKCNDEFLLSCSDGVDQLQATCGSLAQCDSRNCRCIVCSEGDLRCNGKTRETCTAGGAEWIALEQCPSQEECNPTGCFPCPTPGAHDCAAPGDGTTTESTVLRECTTDGKWQPIDTCDSGPLCSATVESAASNPESFSGKCIACECTPGELSCDGAVLRRCQPNCINYTVIAGCASEPVCQNKATEANASGDAALVDSCPTPCPAPGLFNCDGQTLQQCPDDLTGWETVKDCVPPDLCDLNVGDCIPCTSGEYRCNASETGEAVLETCIDNAWTPEKTCLSLALCQAKPPEDAPGDWTPRCLDSPCAANPWICDGAQLKKCNADLTAYEDVELCASEALCNAASQRCDTPCGNPPERSFRCNPFNPQEVQQCNEDFTAWEFVEECTEEEACNADPSLGPPCLGDCPENPTRCDGLVRQQCDDSSGRPVWTTVATCATNALCECGRTEAGDEGCPAGISSIDGICGNPVCGGYFLPDFQCQDGWLQRCNEGRDGWEDQEFCDDGNACNGTETCQGQSCVAGTPPNCSDNNACTDDWCDQALGCRHANNTGSCSDGNACTTGDSCSGGQCRGGAPPNCNDNNVCTDDSCNQSTGCVHSNNSASCNDSNACTTNDTCSGGSCKGGPALDCDDNNVCTDDSCDKSSGCQHGNNTASCSDGLYCNGAEKCMSGTCRDAADPCSGSTPACIEETDKCVECTSDDHCTEPETCGGGGRANVCGCTPSCPACLTSSQPDGCGDTCPANCKTSCNSGACSACGNGTCGSGENCSSCPADCGCTTGQECVDGTCSPTCGNGTCGSGEDCSNCPADCGDCCGNNACDHGEDCASCPDDCGMCSTGGSGGGDAGAP